MLRLYFRSIDKDNHMIDDLPNDDSKRAWLTKEIHRR